MTTTRTTTDHETYVEFEGPTYYWWCAAEDCDVEPDHYATETEAADAASAHRTGQAPAPDGIPHHTERWFASLSAVVLHRDGAKEKLDLVDAGQYVSIRVPTGSTSPSGPTWDHATQLAQDWGRDLIASSEADTFVAGDELVCAVWFHLTKDEAAAGLAEGDAWAIGTWSMTISAEDIGQDRADPAPSSSPTPDV